MTTDLDIYRSARDLIDPYGDDSHNCSHAGRRTSKSR